jgi:hypothetical protein
MTDKPDSSIVQPLDERGGVVRTAIIHDHDLEVDVLLSQNRVQRPSE